MSENENHHHGKNEIVVVKRHGGGDHEGHHGGAWKIAYADFMTAMMAFFLVMWLVNAANEQTKASITSYFNPIKLADEKPTVKGLKKPVDQAEGEETKEKSKQKAEDTANASAAETGKDETSTAGDQTNYSEADFFENPYSVLAEIAQEVGQQANVSAKGEGGAADSGPATGADGGKAYRDPFDPDFWTKQVEVSTASKKAADTETAGEDTPKGEVVAMAKATATDDGKVTTEPQTPEEKPTLSQDDAGDAVERSASEQTTPLKPGGKDAHKAANDAAEGDAKPASKKDQQAAKELQQEIARQISGVAGQLAEGLVVTSAEGGLLVTLSDQSNDPMFNVGSAVPRREMVLAMEKIGKILADRKGAVVIRGHTDARPFKGGKNDNWRLSLDRAQSAYYMLVHGGLDEKRVSQVSGFADRRLKLPDDPFNDANRRIEILVQGDQG
ncbi:MotB family protein [Rhizobium sp. RAF56]|jgi:chemotaxis protein MotB|uniref:MotB family protein n=1 Tax=Rhizobium sp. RAF56 TaxID=3233062 RepID=UPI003F9E572F